MNALELINKGSNKLRQKKIITYRLDSEILLSKVLEKKREVYNSCIIYNGNYLKLKPIWTV